MHNNPFGQDEERPKKFFGKVKTLVVLFGPQGQNGGTGFYAFPG